MIRFLNAMRDPKTYGAVRHLLSTLGGVLAARGVVAESEWELWVGLGMAVLAVVLSVTAPEKKR